MYTFNDFAGRSITLRPEGTSPVTRSYVEHKAYAGVQPHKYYYNIPCFRYEKPQSGRLREFHQFGVEIFESSDMMADAEVIAIGYDFIKEMGITDVELQINSVGCPECRKKHREALRKFLEPKFDQLCPTCQERFNTNPMRILDCKSPIDQELVKDAPMMLDYLCDECSDAFEDLKKNLDAFGIEYTVNPKIVRGLDYYTKTAFEFVTTRIGAQGTVCGGGRYDGLIEEIGGPSTPGVGWGMGKERMLMTMEACGVEIPRKPGTAVFIAYVGEEPKKAAMKLMKELRDAGVGAQMDVMGRSLKNQFKHANRIEAAKTIVIGDDELSSGKLTIKDMVSGDQKEVSRDQIVEELK
jgi:histidyl-tRNA synthetase